MSRSINFKQLKSEVSLEAVLLDYYKVQTLKRRGTKLIGPCPIHGGDSKRAFHADLNKNLWHCFTSCGRGGDQLNLVAQTENISIREAALRLADYFLGDQTPRPPPRRERPLPREPPRTNRPLSFRLTVQPHHPHLQKQRGLSLATCQNFGVGYANRGMMKGCIAIPIHNNEGKAVAYAGRRLDPEAIERYGKYRFPRGFHKDLVLYNWHRLNAEARQREVIVVEGFFSAMALHQIGYPHVVATMGCSLSHHQAKLLTAAKPRSIIILFDGNDAGRQGAERARALLAEIQPNQLVQVMDLGEDREPEDLTPAELTALFDQS